MKYIFGIIIGVALFVIVGVVKAGEDSLPYRHFELEGSCGIKRFVDPDNGNICYVTNACGYKGLGISCLKNN